MLLGYKFSMSNVLFDQDNSEAYDNESKNDAESPPEFLEHDHGCFSFREKPTMPRLVRPAVRVVTSERHPYA